VPSLLPRCRTSGQLQVNMQWGSQVEEPTRPPPGAAHVTATRPKHLLKQQPRRQGIVTGKRLWWCEQRRQSLRAGTALSQVGCALG
jgi:hypothetical protein